MFYPLFLSYTALSAGTLLHAPFLLLISRSLKSYHYIPSYILSLYTLTPHPLVKILMPPYITIRPGTRRSRPRPASVDFPFPIFFPLSSIHTEYIYMIHTSPCFLQYSMPGDGVRGDFRFQSVFLFLHCILLSCGVSIAITAGYWGCN